MKQTQTLKKVRCTSAMISGRYVGYWDGEMDEYGPAVFFPYATASIIVERAHGTVYRSDMEIPWTHRGNDPKVCDKWVFDYKSLYYGSTLMLGCIISSFNWKIKVLEELPC